MLESFLRAMVRAVVTVVALVQAKKDVVFVISFL
jgi:tRNA U38,U39,U40 pseudouridine synthase TruA